MPYRIAKRDGYDIINKETGKKVGHSDTLTKAKSSVRARMGAEHGWKPTRRKK